MPSKKPEILNREISWLYFNARVLQEAADPATPVIEKVRFLGIFSNNLDEFYRIRVATLNRMLIMGSKIYHDAEINPRKTLKEINRMDKEQQREFLRIFDDVLKELTSHGIFIINENDLDAAQGAFVKQYFKEHVRPRLFPIMLSNLQSNALHDRSVYLVVSMKSRDKSLPEKSAIIEIPVSPLPRFIQLPSGDERKYIILLDDVIRYCLGDIFNVLGYSRFEAYTIKFTRDAELDIDSDVSKSFLEIMSESLRQREVGTAVRFTYDKDIPGPLLNQLLAKIGNTKRDTLVPGGRYHNFKDFMRFPNLGLQQLEYKPLPPIRNASLPENGSMLQRIREKDLMLHFPYQSFHYILDLLREASLDPHVRAIKMTLYRVAHESNIVNALINAARNGKEVTVFLEVQARFDEEANIYWAERLQHENVHVIQSIPGYKVHAKLLLIRRKESEKNVYYAGVGTGNFNENTARVYTDKMLLTANRDIAGDVNSVFHLFESRYNAPRFRELIVAPFHMRSFFVRLINKEIKNAREGREAWIILKLNNLVDQKIVSKLYEAGNAGVNVQLIVRGICVLSPGVKNLSEKIDAISIVGRFLEHSRVVVFANGGKPLYYITSADWMVRNFDHRIEVACPVYDPDIQKELLTILQIQLKDNTKARLLSAAKPNQYKTGIKGMRYSSQDEIYKYLKDKV